MQQYSKFIGMDVHKASIHVAVAEMNGGEVASYGPIVNTPQAIAKMVANLTRDGEWVGFCYETGPCGYDVYRQITAKGCDCIVVATSKIPRCPGDRIKTDRRDARSLARLFRSESLTAVWVPGPEQEAVRDLVRCREDIKKSERQSKQRLGAFLLRHGVVYSGKSNWTQAHFRWLENHKFSHSAQQIVLQEYLEAIYEASRRIKTLEREMDRVLETWVFAPVVEGLMALRGVAKITAMTIMAELGDLRRFDSPRKLMGYLGLVPSEHSSGTRRRQGGITKTGNSHVRRVLVEASWSYRFTARKTALLQRRAKKAPAEIQAIAWEAQKRLCGRYQHLIARGKCKTQTCAAVARELCGFIWSIGCTILDGSLAANGPR